MTLKVEKLPLGTSLGMLKPSLILFLGAIYTYANFNAKGIIFSLKMLNTWGQTMIWVLHQTYKFLPVLDKSFLTAVQDIASCFPAFMSANFADTEYYTVSIHGIFFSGVHISILESFKGSLVAS